MDGTRSSAMSAKNCDRYSKVFKILAYLVLAGVIVFSAYFIFVSVAFAIGHQNY